MRITSFAGLGIAALALAGCVATTPMPGTAPIGQTTPQTPTVLDAASRQVARNVINTEMQKRLPGANTAPYTDCVVNNATTAELIDIAQATRAGIGGTADSVASIVSRPATTQCIAAAAQSGTA
ncbi:hypothetical protein SAMN04489859_100647 [Paracoccus alcaliphilus]|uniref:Succinate dehydrogenase n=1 Tax=Paracoccus alcaliphilus TaxID=34002 RepID=A0A1H8G9N5_9RHOB|nr:hypothetical protein [Paracoccus alcaliphilus]WCR17884.1 hypothetical protein JHW40_16560 [Paracoccus alcaliphilus]SEN40237.1 hypothetical protein SAMN04489859_100647 [Paracoccus alcaliphilus]